MSWKQRFTFRDANSVQQEVGGGEFRFYPNRMALLHEARDLSTPVAQAISVLFADESRDAGSSVLRQNDGEFFSENVETQPIDIEMAKHRQGERDRAIEKILGTLADPRSVILLGKLFMDSLRDEFPYKRDRSAAEVEEFLYGSEEAEAEYRGLDAPSLVQMFSGWMRANAKVFGEPGEKLVGLVRSRIEGLQESGSESPESTSGNSSKTPSSSPSDTDSQPST